MTTRYDTVVKVHHHQATTSTNTRYVQSEEDVCYLQSTYTGVFADGGSGPTNVDGKADLSELCDRSDANVRGVTQKFANSR